MRKMIIRLAIALAATVALIVPASASARPAAVSKVTVTISSCSVASTTQGVPAQCSTNSPGHGNSYAYKVFSMQVHVKANPGGQTISQASLNMGCTGPGSGPGQPTGQMTLGYQNPGVTPFASLTEATPYHRFCTAVGNASVPEGLIHVWITAVIVKGAKHTTG
jgi:hypothetical protein